MNLQPRIETLAPKKLVGKHQRMSLHNNTTGALWSSFMPQRKHIRHTIGNDLYSMQVYDAGMAFSDFTPATWFDKWAAIEVSAYESIPEGMEAYDLSGGLYAVFLYKGKPENFEPTFHYIYGTWLPQSEYEPDQREHFEVLGERYKNNNDDSEEEVWVPIRLKIEDGSQAA